jgi:EAL domain-containing protein (putative c-di-GMP-specific phosphodiesterase class I)
MIKSIIDLARNFNLEVVAEGVENMDQVELLRQLQVDYFQGYYFGKPVDVEQFHQQFLS